MFSGRSSISSRATFSCERDRPHPATLCRSFCCSPESLPLASRAAFDLPRNTPVNRQPGADADPFAQTGYGTHRSTLLDSFRMLPETQTSPLAESVAPVSLGQRFGPALLASILYVALTATVVLGAWRASDHHFIYALDDTYIGMAMAKSLALHGVWGVTPFAFSSSDSSLLFPHPARCSLSPLRRQPLCAARAVVDLRPALHLRRAAHPRRLPQSEGADRHAAACSSSSRRSSSSASSAWSTRCTCC